MERQAAAAGHGVTTHRTQENRLAVVRLAERLRAFRRVAGELTPYQRERAMGLLMDTADELWTVYRTPLPGPKARAQLEGEIDEVLDHYAARNAAGG